MSAISPLSQVATPSILQTTAKPAAKTAPDGDSPAVEAAESAATERSEKANNGFSTLA